MTAMAASSDLRTTRDRRALPEPPVDVVDCPRSWGELNMTSVGPSSMPPGVAVAARKKAQVSETRGACCMLWVTMTIVISGQVRDRLLDAAGRGRVQGRARFVHEEDFGRRTPGSGRCTAAVAGRRRVSPGRLSRLRTSFHRPAFGERLLDELAGVGRLASVERQTGEHVLVDRHRREGVRRWKTMPMRRPHVDGSLWRVVGVDTVEQDPSGGLAPRIVRASG